MKRKTEPVVTLKNPVVIKLETSWVFTELPDDFEGTRKDAIQYFKEDIADNFGEFFDTRYVSHHLSVAK